MHHARTEGPGKHDRDHVLPSASEQAVARALEALEQLLLRQRRGSIDVAIELAESLCFLGHCLLVLQPLARGSGIRRAVAPQRGELGADRPHDARDALVRLLRAVRGVALLECTDEKLAERVLTVEVVGAARELRAAEPFHLHGENVRLQRVEAKWDGQGIHARETKSRFENPHLAMHASAHVAHEAILPHERNDVHRLRGSLGSLHRHLRDAGEQRLHAVVRPANGAFGVKEHTFALERPFDGVVPSCIAAVVGDEIVHAPETRCSRDDSAVRPTRHARGDVRRNFLVDHPIGAELRVIRSQKRDRGGVDGRLERGAVGGREVDAAHPEVPVPERQVADERNQAKDRQSSQQKPSVHHTEQPHHRGIRSGTGPTMRCGHVVEMD